MASRPSIDSPNDHYDQAVQVFLDEQIFTIQKFGGISRVFHELARQFHSNQNLGVQLIPFDAPVVNHYLLNDVELARALVARRAQSTALALGRFLVRPVQRVDADIIHNTFYLPHGLSRSTNAKRVVTIHDMIPELFPRTRRRLDFITEKHRYVMAADHIVCVSQSAKSDLLKIYPDVTAEISVIHHGINDVFQPGLPPLTNLPDRYFIHVGNRQSYKDAETLFRAFAQTSKKERADSDVQLVLIGGGQLRRSEQALLQDLGIQDRVQQHSFGDTQLAAAYGNAIALVVPSTYEGFGIPVIEAMGSGCPVVLARSSSLTEVGGDAAHYFTPTDINEVSQLLSELLNSSQLRQQQGEKGLIHAQAFSWSKAASEYAEVYRSLAAL